MAVITKETYCKICDSDILHEQGIFKCKEIGEELFFLNTSLSDSLKKVSAGFMEFVEEHGGTMDRSTPENYACSTGGGLNFEELFSPTVRSLKCEDCGHLIRISRLP